MIYIVKRGDTLARIAAVHGISLGIILENNMICNPNLIFIGQPIYIPDRGINYGKVGGGPYYVVQYGDTLACIAAQFNKTITSLAATNQISNINQIFVGDELLIRDWPNPEQLLIVDGILMIVNIQERMLHLISFMGVHFFGKLLVRQFLTSFNY